MFFKKKESYITAYTDGTIIPISEVKDEVFSQKMMGDGLAIYPESDTIYAPCDGIVTAVFEQTQHAVGITMENGMEILLHVGLDTVNLHEPIFHTHVKKDEAVKQGQTLITYDKEALAALGYSDVTMCVILSNGNTKEVELLKETKAVANKTNIIRYK